MRKCDMTDEIGRVRWLQTDTGIQAEIFNFNLRLSYVLGVCLINLSFVNRNTEILNFSFLLLLLRYSWIFAIWWKLSFFLRVYICAYIYTIHHLFLLISIVQRVIRRVYWTYIKKEHIIDPQCSGRSNWTKSFLILVLLSCLKLLHPVSRAQPSTDA